jgi:hypothetical protein
MQSKPWYLSALNWLTNTYLETPDQIEADLKQRNLLRLARSESPPPQQIVKHLSPTRRRPQNSGKSWH